MTPFYRKALDLFARTQSNQIAKGLQKYHEPFNPHSWTPEELLNHALEETVDLTHYLVGLKELLDEKDIQIENLKYLLEQEKAKVRLEYVGPLPKKPRVKSPFEEQMEGIQKPGNIWTNKGRKSPYDLNFNPHFDQDDQY